MQSGGVRDNPLERWLYLFMGIRSLRGRCSTRTHHPLSPCVTVSLKGSLCPPGHRRRNSNPTPPGLRQTGTLRPKGCWGEEARVRWTPKLARVFLPPTQAIPAPPRMFQRRKIQASRGSHSSLPRYTQRLPWFQFWGSLHFSGSYPPPPTPSLCAH